jgi:hypothetical protein
MRELGPQPRDPRDSAVAGYPCHRIEAGRGVPSAPACPRRRRRRTGSDTCARRRRRRAPIAPAPGGARTDVGKARDVLQDLLQHRGDQRPAAELAVHDERDEPHRFVRVEVVEGALVDVVEVARRGAHHAIVGEIGGGHAGHHAVRRGELDGQIGIRSRRWSSSEPPWQGGLPSPA